MKQERDGGIRCSAWLGGDACNHKFVDSRCCLKCGWQPPARTPSEQTEYEALRKEMELCELGDRPPSPAAAKIKRLIELEMLSPPNDQASRQEPRR